MGLLRDNEDETSPRTVPTRVYVVDGVPTTNSAAKFWPALADEVFELYPACTAIELAACPSAPFAFEQLFPAWSLQQELEARHDESFEEAMAALVAELELFGPPGPVTLRLLGDGAVLLTRDLPLERVDAETFPFLVVWLLEWAGIHHSRWNDDALDGRVAIEDRACLRRYGFAFRLMRTHLGEGLYRRTIALSVNVSDAA